MRQDTSSGSKDLFMRFAGEGGEGVISLGEILTSILSSMGWETLSFKAFPPTIRGGQALYDLRISDRRVLSTGENPDLLLAMNREALLAHGRFVAPGGLILADADDEDTPNSAGIAREVEVIYLPFARIARDILSFQRGKNMVCLGSIARLFNLDESDMLHHLKIKFGSKGATVVEKNINCFRMGFKYMAGEIVVNKEFRIAPLTGMKERHLIDGNQAVAIGALAAGCKFFAGYPISPATGIMEFLADKLPCLGGYVLQMEDEIAALAAALGASFGGSPSMTATSGPGLSLMSELIGLASMAELPVVIVDVQRGGPSTGMPTKTEQSDLNLAIMGSHGEGPRAVLAAADVADCFHQTIEAFRIAEKYQLPVVLLSDQHLAYSTQSILLKHLQHGPVEPRLKPSVAAVAYERYAITDTGISPMPAAGDPGFNYTLTGLEHEPSGRPTHHPDIRENMVNKRARKIATLSKEPGGVTVSNSGHQSAIISWGSTFGDVVEAIRLCKGKKVHLDHVHVKRLYPLPCETLTAFMQGKKMLISIELNQSGQLASLIEKSYHTPVHRLTSSRGLPFRPRELADRIEALYKNER